MLTLYDFGNSVCCQKVRITLKAKRLAWEAVRVDLFRSEQYDPAYLKLNPKGVVPTLVHDGRPVIEFHTDLRVSRRDVPRTAAHAGRPVAQIAHAVVEQDGRRGAARGGHRA